MVQAVRARWWERWRVSYECSAKRPPPLSCRGCYVGGQRMAGGEFLTKAVAAWGSTSPAAPTAAAAASSVRGPPECSHSDGELGPFDALLSRNNPQEGVEDQVVDPLAREVLALEVTARGITAVRWWRGFTVVAI